MKRSVQVEETLQGLNWGNFCLFISISTGGPNTQWLLRTWTSWWNHCWLHGRSAGYNFYMFRNKMKQVTRALKMTSHLTCVPGGAMNPMMRWARPRPCQMCWLMVEKLLGNIWPYTVYQQRKMMRGAVLDLPLKGKTTETSVAEGATSIVQPAPRTGWASGHLSIF